MGFLNAQGKMGNTVPRESRFGRSTIAVMATKSGSDSESNEDANSDSSGAEVEAVPGLGEDTSRVPLVGPETDLERAPYSAPRLARSAPSHKQDMLFEALFHNAQLKRLAAAIYSSRLLISYTLITWTNPLLGKPVHTAEYCYYSADKVIWQLRSLYDEFMRANKVPQKKHRSSCGAGSDPGSQRDCEEIDPADPIHTDRKRCRLCYYSMYFRKAAEVCAWLRVDDLDPDAVADLIRDISTYLFMEAFSRPASLFQDPGPWCRPRKIKEILTNPLHTTTDALPAWGTRVYRCVTEKHLMLNQVRDEVSDYSEVYKPRGEAVGFDSQRIAWENQGSRSALMEELPTVYEPEPVSIEMETVKYTLREHLLYIEQKETEAYPAEYFDPDAPLKADTLAASSVV